MVQIRRDAAALPGETADLARIFKLASIPGLQAGASTDRIEKLSANAMAYGMGVANLDSGTVSRELSMLMSGRAGSHNVLGLQLAGLGGDKAEAFNKMSGKDRFAFLEEQFGKHAGSIELFANSFEGISSTLRDNAKLFLTSATSSLFEKVKGTLGDANTWFTEHQSEATKWASIIGAHLADGFTAGKNEILRWIPAVETFAVNAEERIERIWHKVGPVLAALSAGVRDILADPKTLDHLDSILKLYAVAKGGQMLAPAAGGMFGAVKSVAGLMGGGGGGGAGALGGLAAPEVLAGLGVALAALFPVAVAAAGAVDNLTDVNSKYHASTMRAAKEIEDNLDRAAGTVKTAGRDMSDALRPFVDEAGSKFTIGLHWTSIAANDAAEHVGILAHNIKRLGELAGFGSAAPNLKAETRAKEFADTGGDKLSARTEKAMVNAGAGGGAGVHIGTQIIHMTIASNQEPSRIARLTKNALAEKARYPTASAHAPNYSRAAR
jgi:hypothetical protein